MYCGQKQMLNKFHVLHKQKSEKLKAITPGQNKELTWYDCRKEEDIIKQFISTYNVEVSDNF